MSRPIRAPRYLDKHNQWLAEYATEVLPFADMDEALGFYGKVWPTMRDQDKALLACNDRFFLLRALLGRRDLAHPWLYDRCREVESDPDGRLDLWAREHYKSTIITYAGTSQEVLADPEQCACIFSFRKSIAQKFLSQIMRDFERNNDLKQVFNDVLWERPRVEAPTWSKSDGIVVKRHGNPSDPSILASGLVDGMPTGGHFNLMVYDDVVTDKSVTNPEMVAATTEAWELSDNLGAGDVRVWHIGTRYSFADSYGQILERNALIPRIYPATDNGQMDGKLVFISEKRWQDKIKKQRSTLAAQMLQNPLSGKENTFNPQWICRWEVRPSILNIYILVDPASGKHKRNDRTAMAVIGIGANGKKLLLDGACHRMSLSERWGMLRHLWLKWSGERGVRLVKVGYERYGLQADIEHFKGEMMKAGEPQFEILEVNVTSDGVGNQGKKTRVERLEPDIRTANFLLPALIAVPRDGPSYWEIDATNNHVTTSPLKRVVDGKTIYGISRNMRKMQESGMGHLIAKPIERRNEDGKPYDATRELVDEMIFFPFSPRDDFVDCCSRIYDMEPTAPDPAERMGDDSVETPTWEDA